MMAGVYITRRLVMVIVVRMETTVSRSFLRLLLGSQ